MAKKKSKKPEATLLPAAHWGDVVDPSTPEGIKLFDAATVQLVSSKEQEVAAAEAEFDEAHKVSAERKKNYEAALDQLRALIRERMEWRGRAPERDLFTGAAAVPVVPGAEPEPAAERGTNVPFMCSWRRFPLTSEKWIEWGMKEADVAALINGGITNLGGIDAYECPDAAKPTEIFDLTDFDGFTGGSAKRYKAANEQFWSWWNAGGMDEFEAMEKANADVAGAGSGMPEAVPEGPGEGPATLAFPGAEAVPHSDPPGRKAKLTSPFAEDASATKPKRKRKAKTE